MFHLLFFVRNIPNIIKRKINYKDFNKYAECGAGLDLNARSFCYADNHGCIKIGKNCRIFGKLISQEQGSITIGDNTCIYERSFVGSVDKVVIGNCVIISNHVHIFDNNNHPTSASKRLEMSLGGFDGDPWRWKYADCAPVVIEDNVWIGEYAAVMKGVRIGKGSVVAAHSVVTKDVPEYSIVAGNPARVVKSVEH